MGGGLLRIRKHTGRFHNNVNALLSPRKVRGIALGSDLNLFALDHQVAVDHTHFTGVGTVDAVVLQQMCEGVHIGQVVDGGHFKLRPRHELSESQAADSAKTIDCNALHEKEYELS